MSRFALALMATSALFVVSASPADAQIFGRRNNAETAQVINEAPRCSQNLGTVAIAETQGVLFDQMGLGAPTELLRTVIRDSGCFTLIERGPGMDLVERERNLGGAARVRTADFVLVAELANPIESTDGDRRSGLLGSLAAVGGRALLTAGLAAATGGDLGGGGGLGGLGGLGAEAGLNPLQMQAMNAAMNMAGGALSGQPAPAQALNANTVERIRDLKKDIGRGKEDAQIVFSLASVPLAETVGSTRAVANKDDLRGLRIRDNHFGGRVGAGYENQDEGKVIALALVRGYADLVTSLGGTGDQTPKVTLANREAVRAAAAERDAEAARKAEADRREQERLDRAREEERRRLREEIRREDEARRSADAAPNMASRRLALPTVLRTAPNGDAIRPLAPDATVFPTGKSDGQWVEVLDADDNIGWLQRERLTADQ
ncbi:hypothetical protein NI456_10010 [Brevundimonas diminuta]|uniref:hypothetical protein n=1 Tax=Brevundimonas diminuta TaxID=293 RepID=UPI002097F3E0|nr:hypothetical protein [Brevundimonas diminuta]MCO8019190.1 hypothetical protein [Brevundimonas diminuta]MCO8021867.1 hypothetical protein [Brevundimonas diminuta]